MVRGQYLADWATRGFYYAAVLPTVFGRAVPLLHVSMHGAGRGFHS